METQLIVDQNPCASIYLFGNLATRPRARRKQTDTWLSDALAHGSTIKCLANGRIEGVKVTETKIKLRRWDVVDYLRTEEEIVAYLEAVAEENEPELMVVALGDVARARNMSQLAREVRMTLEGLYKALSSDGNPSFATIMKVAKALVLQLGFLPVRRASADRKVRRQARRALTDASGASR